MSQLGECLSRACSALGLHIKMGFSLVLSDGRRLTSFARIADLGAPNGMLLFRAYDEVREFSQALRDDGYGYCVVDEPRADEQFDLASFEEMFRDWGWSGKPGSKPDWM